MFFHWLNKICKIPKGTVVKPPAHQARYMQILCAAKKLDHAENPPTPRQKKEWYIGQYPRAYRDYYKDSGYSSNEPTQTLDTITESMTKLWSCEQRMGKARKKVC